MCYRQNIAISWLATYHTATRSPVRQIAVTWKHPTKIWVVQSFPLLKIHCAISVLHSPPMKRSFLFLLTSPLPHLRRNEKVRLLHVQMAGCNRCFCRRLPASAGGRIITQEQGICVNLLFSTGRFDHKPKNNPSRHGLMSSSFVDTDATHDQYHTGVSLNLIMATVDAYS
ncbi:hypothetical protein BC832DRAFT_404373 [Gaertneriomyces semiglobifer]|nr:hypothetical protein BC832DRAFT_404373 [Gaertneriomyces semiglobifer]